MKITIFLNNGLQFNATVETYHPSEFTTSMNNPQVTMISIGDMILNKNAVMMIIPTEIVPTK